MARTGWGGEARLSDHEAAARTAHAAATAADADTDLDESIRRAQYADLSAECDAGTILWNGTGTTGTTGKLSTIGHIHVAGTGGRRCGSSRITPLLIHARTHFIVRYGPTSPFDSDTNCTITCRVGRYRISQKQNSTFLNKRAHCFKSFQGCGCE